MFIIFSYSAAVVAKQYDARWHKVLGILFIGDLGSKLFTRRDGQEGR